MTVCIAAACTLRNDPAIVLCHDWQGTVPSVGSSDSFDKQRYVGKGWIALIAGEISHADELVGMLEGCLPEIPSADTAIKNLREKIFDYRERLLDQYLRSTCGIGFERFANDGMKIYPPMVFEQLHRGMIETQIGIEMILTGFVEEVDDETGKPYLMPCIMQVSESASRQLEVSLQDSFACIGEGAASAQASLLFREHDRIDNLQKTTYRVYEAKTVAEIIPTVGPSSSIYLQRPKKEIASISGEGFERCVELFKLYGPKSIKRNGLRRFQITADMFEVEHRTRARVAAHRKGLLAAEPMPSTPQT